MCRNSPEFRPDTRGLSQLGFRVVDEATSPRSILNRVDSREVLPAGFNRRHP